jgi:hypothetical protein
MSSSEEIIPKLKAIKCISTRWLLKYASIGHLVFSVVHAPVEKPNRELDITRVKEPCGIKFWEAMATPIGLSLTELHY